MTILFGVVARLPLGGLTWPEAMGLVVINGLIIVLLVATGLRRLIFDAVPMQLKLAIAARIGLFILFIGLVDAGFIGSTGLPSPPVGLGTGGSGSISTVPTVVFMFTMLVTGILFVRLHRLGRLSLGSRQGPGDQAGSVERRRGLPLLLRARLYRIARRHMIVNFALAFEPDTSRVEASAVLRARPFWGGVVADSNDWPVRGQDGSVAMTLGQARDNYRQHDAPGIHTPRLRLKPKASQSGYVDGAWWPRSDDLTTELPDLIAVLSFRLGPIDRVTYNLNEWTRAPVELATGGRAVHLDGHHRQPPNTVEVQDANLNKMVLLVVPLQTDPDHAHAIVMAAAAPSNSSNVDSLLEISEQDRESRTRATAAHKRWESQAAERSTSRDRRRPQVTRLAGDFPV